MALTLTIPGYFERVLPNFVRVGEKLSRTPADPETKPPGWPVSHDFIAFFFDFSQPSGYLVLEISTQLIILGKP